MKLERVVEHMLNYAKCPNCGNEYVGINEGIIEVDGDKFTRACKCGYNITIVEKMSDEHGSEIEQEELIRLIKKMI